MNRLLKGSLCFTLSLGLITGCGAIPLSGETILASSSPRVETELEQSNLIEPILALLPPLAEIVTPANMENDPPILLRDINGDGSDEAILVYRLSDQVNSLKVAIFTVENEGWKKIWDEAGQGYDIDHMELADLDGDGLPELLLGWTIGASAGSVLEIYGWTDGQLNLLDQTGYNQLEIQGVLGNDKQGIGKGLVLWTKDTGIAFHVEVYRFADKKLVVDPELYPQYFPEVVDYYEEQLKEHPDGWILWYYLADAQLKTGQPDEALQTIETAKKLEPDQFLVDRLYELEEMAKELKSKE